jgi:hypothetical protein
MYSHLSMLSMYSSKSRIVCQSSYRYLTFFRVIVHRLLHIARNIYMWGPLSNCWSWWVAQSVGVTKNSMKGRNGKVYQALINRISKAEQFKMLPLVEDQVDGKRYTPIGYRISFWGNAHPYVLSQHERAVIRKYFHMKKVTQFLCRSNETSLPIVNSRYRRLYVRIERPR